MHGQPLWTSVLGLVSAATQPAEAAQLSGWAVGMAIAGAMLLFGGMCFCIGIAWYHGKNPRPGDDENGMEGEVACGQAQQREAES